MISHVGTTTRVHFSFYFIFYTKQEKKMIKILLSMQFFPVQRKGHSVRLVDIMVQLRIKW